MTVAYYQFPQPHWGGGGYFKLLLHFSWLKRLTKLILTTDRLSVFLFFIRSESAADPPCVSQKMGDKRKLDNATGKWDLGKANLHMYNFAMVREFLADKLDLHTDLLINCTR
jgi:hypothetical protein